MLHNDCKIELEDTVKFGKVLGIVLSMLANYDNSFAMDRDENDVESLGIVVCPLSKKTYRYSVHYEPSSLKFGMDKIDANHTMISQSGSDVSIVTSDMVTARINALQIIFNAVGGSIQIKHAKANNIKVSAPTDTVEYNSGLMLSFPIVSLETFYSNINTIDVRNLGFAVTGGDTWIKNISVKNATLFNIISYGELSIGKIDVNCNLLQFFNFAKLEDLTVDEINGNCKQLAFNESMSKIKKKNLTFQKAHFRRKKSK